MTFAIRTVGLTKRYDDVAAVDGLDLEVERGALYGFLGPNGAGKTTTIRMALGLIHPTGGAIEVLGSSVATGHGPLERVGALVEEPAFWPYLSGRRNLEASRAPGATGRTSARGWTRVDDVSRAGRADRRGRQAREGSTARACASDSGSGSPWSATPSC